MTDPAREKGDDPQRRARVLVIDDEPLMTRALALVLGEHEVVTENSAQDGLLRIGRGEQFDVVLCDLMMPQMDGMEFFEFLQRIWPEVSARVIFMTAGTTDPLIRGFRAHVPNPCLDKPLNLRALRDLISHLIGGDSTTASSRAECA